MYHREAKKLREGDWQLDMSEGEDQAEEQQRSPASTPEG